MSENDQIKRLNKENYIKNQKIKKLESEKKELMKQLKESEKSKTFWKDAYNRLKGDK